MTCDAAPAAAVTDPAAERDRLIALYHGERNAGWATCLLCRSVYRDTHRCTAPGRRIPAAGPALVGAFEDRGQHRPGFFGSRLGIGFYWMGSTEDLPRRPRHRSYHPTTSIAANTARFESFQEAEHWRQYRLRRDFFAGAPRIALAAFRDAAGRVGVRPREAGHVDPPGSRRYRVIGAARLGGYETVVDLGFWLGPYQPVSLEPACMAAENAILRRWPFSGRAGFSWSDVKT